MGSIQTELVNHINDAAYMLEHIPHYPDASIVLFPEKYYFTQKDGEILSYCHNSKRLYHFTHTKKWEICPEPNPEFIRIMFMTATL